MPTGWVWRVKYELHIICFQLNLHLSFSPQVRQNIRRSRVCLTRSQQVERRRRSLDKGKKWSSSIILGAYMWLGNSAKESTESMGRWFQRGWIFRRKSNSKNKIWCACFNTASIFGASLWKYVLHFLKFQYDVSNAFIISLFFLQTLQQTETKTQWFSWSNFFAVVFDEVHHVLKEVNDMMDYTNSITYYPTI